MLIIALALIDIHTLGVLLFHENLSFIWVLSGSTLAIMKGLLFYLPSRDIFSLLDMICGLLMLFLLLGGLWAIIWWAIFFYLSYKIFMSFLSY